MTEIKVNAKVRNVNAFELQETVSIIWEQQETEDGRTVNNGNITFVQNSDHPDFGKFRAPDEIQITLAEPQV